MHCRRRPFETLDTRECHHRAALAVHPGLLDHPGHRGLGDQERAGEVDGDHSLPLGAVEQMDRPAACDTSGVNDPVESTWYRRECRHDRGFVGHIGRHEVEPCAHVLVRCGQVDAYHRAAVGQQSPGGGEPDSRCRPGDDERSRTGPITAPTASPISAPRPALPRRCVIHVTSEAGHSRVWFFTTKAMESAEILRTRPLVVAPARSVTYTVSP